MGRYLCTVAEGQIFVLDRRGVDRKVRATTGCSSRTICFGAGCLAVGDDKSTASEYSMSTLSAVSGQQGNTRDVNGNRVNKYKQRRWKYNGSYHSTNISKSARLLSCT
jgi:hypothetical protein